MTAFCVTIVKNTSIDMIRQSKRFAYVDTVDNLKDELEVSFEDDYINKSEILRLSEIIDMLPQEDRLLIQMKYVQEMRYAEIGALLGISEETAKKRGQRIIQKLKIIWGGVIPVSENFPEILKLAAKLNFEQEISKTASDTDPSPIEVDLDCMQIQKLSEKVLLLPPQGMFVLFSKYCFLFTPAETELFYHLQKAKELLTHYRKLLSFVVGIKESQIISDSSFRDACKIALYHYLDQELYANQHQPVFLMSKTRTVFRK